MSGGLRPCWMATIEAPIIGPIADSNNVIWTTFPAARSNPTYTSMTSGPNLTLRFAWGFPEGLACASLGDARANKHPIEPSRP
jgi:hypothetical protein